MKNAQGLSMTDALNQIAIREGFSSWSLLQSRSDQILPSRYSELLDFFNDGDLVVIASRPGMGKTSFTMGLFVQAAKQASSKSFYFTLSETHKDLARRIGAYDQLMGENKDQFELNYSNDICAEYIISVTKGQVGSGGLIVIDYLQLLDEKRVNPPIQTQIEKLKTYAKEKRCTIVFLSQIDRSLENMVSKRPGIDDIRLPKLRFEAHADAIKAWVTPKVN